MKDVWSSIKVISLVSLFSMISLILGINTFKYFSNGSVSLDIIFFIDMFEMFSIIGVGYIMWYGIDIILK